MTLPFKGAKGDNMANYFYFSTSGDGWINLGTDEWFIDHFGKDDMILYLYINENAVIIGRNQNPWAECNLSAMERDDVQLVRRITGGGAVYHDCGNLNFSFIAGADRYDQDAQMDMILSAVRKLGIPCEFTGRNDLTADGKKFSGNAFCARRGVRQHHGTLLIGANLAKLQNYLQVDPRKLQAKGTKSVRSRVCNLSEFQPGLTTGQMARALEGAFFAHYGAYKTLAASDLPHDQLAPYWEKQRSWAWRLGETPQFDVEIENRFAWGNVQILLTLRHTEVTSVKVYSDALDTELPDEIAALLNGCRFGAKPLAEALAASPKQQIRELAGYILLQNL